MKSLATRSAALVAVSAILLTSGCGGPGGSGGSGQGDGYSETAEGYYLRGYELGAQDARSGLTESIARHGELRDPTFTAQFDSGYRQGYGLYRR